MCAQDGYAEDLVRYAALHPKAPRVRRPQRPPGALKRPTSAYIHFLADFRADYKARLATAHVCLCGSLSDCDSGRLPCCASRAIKVCMHALL